MPAPRPEFVARGRGLPMGERTFIMAIVNLTEDSFSGDGVGANVDAAVRKAVVAVEKGADIIDLGAESARADRPALELEDEARLIAAAVPRVLAETGAIVSVDTYKPRVARSALEAGAHVINDIGGMLRDSEMARVVAAHDAALIINFTVELPKVRPATPPRYDDLIEQHAGYLRERARRAIAAGVSPRSIAVDPGIAFGKSHDEDLQVLRRLDEFSALGRPVLVAASRKHVIGSATGLPVSDRDIATAAITALAIARGADIVRVHDVGANVQAARMADAIVRGASGDFAATDESWPWAADASPTRGTRIGESS